MTKNHGRFTYQLTANGNLIGEHSNNHSTHAEVEAAIRVTSEGIRVHCIPKDPFVGEYYCIWTEGFGSSHSAILSIKKKEGHPHIFEVKWIDIANRTKIVHSGEAMLDGSRLVGNYS